MIKFLVFCFLICFVRSVPEDDNYKIGVFSENEEIIQFRLIKNSKYRPNDNLNELHVQINKLNDYRVRISVKPVGVDEKRFEAPVQLDLNQTNANVNTRLYSIKVGGNGDDSSILKIIRRNTGTQIWSMDLGKLIFNNHIIRVTNELASTKLYGFAEHMDSYLKDFENKPKTILLHNRGELPRPDNPLYGSHPVYLNYENVSSTIYAHSVFLLNSNPMEVVLFPNKTLTYTVLGGVLDFFINVGPTPNEAVKQYVSLVGKPPLIPRSALGFHLCRWGYNSLEKTKAALERTIAAKIPIDYQWNDIDYMDEHNDFTIDNQNFSGLKEWVDELHSKNLKYALILDPGLPTNLSETEYPQFYDALNQNIFVKDSNGQLAQGKVWNKYKTVFPDFSNPKSEQFWVSNLIELNKKVDFDMLWIDMNEPALLETLNCSYTIPKYTPEKLKPLHQGTLCFDAEHHLGKHSEIHNLYAYFQQNYTRNALLKMGKRPFIISRATFAGSGRFSSHWTGDVDSNWVDLRISISNMLEFNILGIPVVGADICGFDHDTTEELCARWQALGAFYPFSRNHNTIKTRDQDPVSMGEKVVAAARNALNLRYSLIHLLYTEIYRASIDGSPAVKSLSLVWPEDVKTYEIEDQFLWGEKLMVIPIIEEGKVDRKAYLPKGLWYDYSSGELLNGDKNNNTGVYISLHIPLDQIQLAVRGGSILFITEPSSTTTSTVKNPIHLLIALDENNHAEGEIYFDDGESIIKEQNHEFTFVEAKTKDDQLILRPVVSKYQIRPSIEKIKIVGVNLRESLNFYLNGNKINSKNVNQVNSNTIEIEGLKIDLNKTNRINWN